MKAAFLTANKSADESFEIRETEKPKIKPDDVLVKVETFGLNYADVLARQGLYPDAPELPGVLGYECVGTVAEVGAEVKNCRVGERVLAFTRFGSYAEYVATSHMAVTQIPDDIDNGIAAALATQACTALYSFREMANVQQGERVIIHAAAGGLGMMFVQLAKSKGCKIFGTASNPEKLQMLSEMGVQHPINYREQDFEEVIKGKVDVVFDPIGGKTFKKNQSKLGYGGRHILLGISERSGKKPGLLNLIQTGLSFGIKSPIQFLIASNGLIGVNMLRIADHKPETISRLLKDCVQLWKDGVLKPTVDSQYPAEEVAKAHTRLESRKSMGKVVVNW